MLNNKRILLGVTASIALHKSIALLRLLVKEGAEVKVMMTPNAKQFVSPIVFSTFSSHKVYSEFIGNDQWQNHVSLGMWADIFLIAPLSCNTLAKMANGICDNILMATYLSARCPIIVCPAMDENMLHHSATQKNLHTLSLWGHEIVNSNVGELASGLYGGGRMAEPEDIVRYVKEKLGRKKLLQGKKVLITVGATKEFIDPVRFISNQSSGKMGYALATKFYELGAEVCVVAGEVNVSAPYKGIRSIPIISAVDMYEAVMQEQKNVDYLVLTAAVADYKPSKYFDDKIKKNQTKFSMEFEKNLDILGTLGSIKRADQTLIGFALETNRSEENAIKKLQEKNADFMILNTISPQNPCFGVDYNKVTIFSKNGHSWDIPSKSK